MNNTNCPNCGAPFHGGRCDYCGTEHPGTIRSSLEITPECIRIDCSEINFFAEDAFVGRTPRLATMYRGEYI